jgi:hypothetical protein
VASALDFHYFLGDIGTIDDPSALYPRIQGHEVAPRSSAWAATALHLAAGMRVAIWPVGSCGECYPCHIGRGNACVRISLTGIHTDGALQERLVLPAGQVFPVGDLDAPLAALVEPVSIAVRAVVRGRVAAGEKVVILGAGPIGQALGLAATDRGAAVLLVDRLESLAHGAATGADFLHAAADGPRPASTNLSAGWAGGRVRGDRRARSYRRPSSSWRRPAGSSSSAFERARLLRVGDLPFRRSTCSAQLPPRRRVRRGGRLLPDAATRRQPVTHEFGLEQAPEAIASRSPIRPR